MNLKLNAERFTGKDYVDLYDKYRPSPPQEIIHQSLNYLHQAQANRVVDLGCGTGLSTKVWADVATEVIGIEPSTEMIAIAESKANPRNNIQYKTGYSNALPLEDSSIDIVACSQSFHWMEPNSTLKEVHRVLKKGGVLVIYDVIWPPSVNVEFEKAYNKLFATVHQVTRRLEQKISHFWTKEAHFKNVQDSTYFDFSKETYFHKTEQLTKEQFIGIAQSQGGLEALLKRGFSEKEVGITKFKEKIAAAAMPDFEEITYNYRAVFAVK